MAFRYGDIDMHDHDLIIPDTIEVNRSRPCEYDYIFRVFLFNRATNSLQSIFRSKKTLKFLEFKQIK